MSRNERILASERTIGASTPSWRPAPLSASNHAFAFHARIDAATSRTFSLAGFRVSRWRMAVTWAVTIDFHNTIARCDEWFNLEVYDLVPAFFAWTEGNLGLHIESERIAAGREHYRTLRRQVMDTGVELDAASSICEVVDFLGLSVERDAVEQAMVDIFRPAVAPAEPMPGLIDSVKCLDSGGVRLAVVSSAAYHPFLEWTLEKFEIDGCFSHVLTSASTGYYKSSTKIYETALERLGSDPAHSIHIGDSVRFDVGPARAVGMRTVLFSEEESDGNADLHIETLVGLPCVLKEEFGLSLEI